MKFESHHGGEDEALVFLLQEDQDVGEQESQGVCGTKKRFDVERLPEAP